MYNGYNPWWLQKLVQVRESEQNACELRLRISSYTWIVERNTNAVGATEVVFLAQGTEKRW